jgi:hypothetical protein
MNKKNEGIYFYKDHEEETTLELIKRLNRFIEKYNIMMKSKTNLDKCLLDTKKKLSEFRIHIKQWTRSIRVKIEKIETLVTSKKYEELDYCSSFTDITKDFKLLATLFNRFMSPGNIKINYRRNSEEYIRRLVFLKRELLAFDNHEFDMLLIKMFEWVENYKAEVYESQEIINDMKKTLVAIKRKALCCTKSREKMLRFFNLILKFINQL